MNDQRAFKQECHAAIDKAAATGDGHGATWVRSEIVGLCEQYDIYISREPFAKQVSLLVAANNAHRAHKLVNVLNDFARGKAATWAIIAVYILVRLALLALFVILVVMAYQWVTA